MKVIVDCDSIYPVFFVECWKPECRKYKVDCNVDNETIQRWKRVSEEFAKVQIEIANCIGDDATFEEIYTFVDIKE